MMPPPLSPQRDRLIAQLCEVPLARHVLGPLAAELLPPHPRVTEGKEINDPIWKIIRLTALEVRLLDSPLMQRLRGIRQLGLAHLVYPGASHTRLEHSIGVMHAGKRMFNMLANTMATSLDEGDHAKALVTTGMACLLHDCGHVAFSHVGEQILGEVLTDDFAQIRRIFTENFAPQVIFKQTDGSIIAPDPRPAEILSALFIISQSMVDLVNRQGGAELPTDDLVLLVAGLIIGHVGSLIFGRQYLHFLKDIVSGDIDADKIDYVARDGYFAGVPLAIDVERLLSQLIAIDLQHGPLPPSVNSNLSTRDVISLNAIGLRPTGASAMEMLVLTRVYLFDRIYLHQKVKAAERFTESVLRSYLSWLVQDAALAAHPELSEDPNGLAAMMTKFYREPTIIARIVTTVMRPGGDDGLLAQIAQLKETPSSVANDIARQADDILFRRLPARALPVALRTIARGDLPSGDRTSKILWPRLKLDLTDRQGRERFEDRVISLCGDDGHLLFDFTQRKPIPEDPDIWVRTSPMAVPERLNRHFSVEQLSNAYQELKETSWVFCDSGQQAAVAAAAAIALYEQFGIVPSAHGLELAKVAAEHYDRMLEQYCQAGKVERSVIDALRLKEIATHLVVHAFELRNYLPKAWGANEVELAARKIARDLSTVELPLSSSDELNALFPLLRLLLLHAHRSHDDFPRWTQTSAPQERFFANDLQRFLDDNKVQEHYLPLKEVTSQPGRIDLLFIHRQRPGMSFVLELKSEDATFTHVVNVHAGQAMAYCTKEYARISILYAQFGGSSFRLSDAIEVRRLSPGVNGEPSPSKLAAICIGHRGFGHLPSGSGKQSTKA